MSPFQAVMGAFHDSVTVPALHRRRHLCISRITIFFVNFISQYSSIGSLGTVCESQNYPKFLNVLVAPVVLWGGS